MKRLTGKIINYVPARGFGFVREPDGTERFFHKSAWKAFALPKIDDIVSYELKPARAHGRPDECSEMNLASSQEVFDCGVQVAQAAMAVLGGAK